MSNARQVEDAPMCFGCGPDNPVGLQLRFSLDPTGRCTAVFTGTENHVGYENIIHGGIIFTALDDVMSNPLCLRNKKALTTGAAIRYRQPLHVGQTVELFGWIESERLFLVELKGEVRLHSHLHDRLAGLEPVTGNAAKTEYVAGSGQNAAGFERDQLGTLIDLLHDDHRFKADKVVRILEAVACLHMITEEDNDGARR